MLADTFFNENTVTAAAEESGKIVGYGFVVSAGEDADLANIAVDESFRRRGIAAGILDNLEGAAASAGVKRIFLEVRVSNAAAMSLYLKRGYIGRYVRPALLRRRRGRAHHAEGFVAAAPCARLRAAKGGALGRFRRRFVPAGRAGGRPRVSARVSRLQGEFCLSDCVLFALFPRNGIRFPRYGEERAAFFAVVGGGVRRARAQGFCGSGRGKDETDRPFLRRQSGAQTAVRIARTV